jgi:membrane associated rhomboid family serine protease
MRLEAKRNTIEFETPDIEITPIIKSIIVVLLINFIYFSGRMYMTDSTSLLGLVLSTISHLNLSHLISNTFGVLACGIMASYDDRSKFIGPLLLFALAGNFLGGVYFYDSVLGISSGTYGYLSYIRPKIGVLLIPVSVTRIYITETTVAHEVHILVSVLGVAAYLIHKKL